MVKIFLDTKALLSYLAGESQIVEKMKQYIGKEELCITSITLFEASVVLKNESIIDELLEAFIVQEITPEIALKAKEIYLMAEEMAIPSPREILTAACCIENNGFLVPGNKKNYVDIPEIKLA